jgi:hypothetical protein
MLGEMANLLAKRATERVLRLRCTIFMKTKHGKSDGPETAARSKVPRKTLAQLQGDERSKALDAFAASLQKMVTGEGSLGREEVLASTGKAIECSFDVRQFDNFLVALGEGGLLKVSQRTNVELERLIQVKHGIRVARVVAGATPERFAEVSAELFMNELDRIARRKREERCPYLCLGIVSGSTIKATIDRTCGERDWVKDFGVSPTNWPQLKIFALNTTPVTPDDIGGNANILCYRFAQKVKRHEGDVQAFGLNAPVVVDRSLVLEIDKTPQTREVLKYTEPHRVDPSRRPDETELDVILTGAGQIEAGNEGQDFATANYKSIFVRLAEEAGLNVQKFIREKNLVGDLGFSPINAAGEEVEIYRSDAKTGESQADKPLVFYSAAHLKVFEKVAQDSRKSVILVARSDQTNKTRIVFASRRYISHLIVDEATASHLQYG